MMLIMHVSVALTSVAYATYLLIAPTKAGLRLSYGLTSLTLGSGAYLLWATGAPMLTTCLTGLLYITAIFIMTLATHRKLLRLEN